jgi:tetratricopeptide (TPR) repeat protein
VRVMQTIFVIFAMTVITSCVYTGGASQAPDSNQITTRMLLDDSPLATSEELANLSQIDILKLSPEMISFLDRWVDPNQADHTKLRRLLYAVMGDGTFDLIYEDSTRTARETFRDQRGNCLSFTNMFVAMSRHLGLDSKFQEVSIPPDWSISGETFVFNLHINALVDLQTQSDQMVDFNMYDFRLRYDREIVSDTRARAHYFNNMGVEYMLEGDTLLALANFLESIRTDNTFSPTWINLGILNNREGYSNYAEAAYLQALYIDGSNLVAISNLAGLYEQEGRTELAAQYRSKVKYHRMRNPYYHYHLGRKAFDIGDYKTAIDHLKVAIRKNKNDDTFYFLISLSYFHNGEKEAAQRWMKKAEDVAETNADKKRYHRKLDLLMSNDTGQPALVY